MTKKQKEYHKKWRQSHKEKWNEYMRKYYANRTLKKISTERSDLERKLAKQIIGDLEKIIEVTKDGEAKFDIRELRKIEKKYTEDTNDGT
jgi:hypothetical protein